MTHSDRPSIVRDRQEPLQLLYREDPGKARITDCALATDGTRTDPFHGVVRFGPEEHGASLRFGIHRAVGGDHDAPNPGDLLCGALAACFDSVVRMIAERLGVRLTRLEVRVEADVDVRGTLQVDPQTPVGFQEIRCRADLGVAEGTPDRMIETLLKAAERSCVVLQTLRSSVSVRAERVPPTVATESA